MPTGGNKEISWLFEDFSQAFDSPIQTEFYENYIISKILKKDQKHLWISVNKNCTNMNIY